jgi:CRP-like cAMP-binding protein
MASSQRTPSKSPNRLLALLSADHYRRLLPDLEPVSLKIRDPIYESQRKITHVYFPLSGVASIVAYMKNGMGVEVATVGNEGMLGLAVFFGADSTPLVAFQQVPGDHMRMTTERFKDELARNGHLTEITQLYTQTLITQIAQGNACNRLHSMEQRCARWLLQTHDRVDKDEFPLTQEFLAQMLGTRRASVSEVANKLGKENLISYTRGVIHIRNRKGLERRSCECYFVVKNEFDRLLGPPD